MGRKIIAILIGTILLVILVSIIIGIFAKSGATSIGQFIRSALREGSLEGFIEFATSDEGLGLWSQGLILMGFVILPLISIPIGFLTGWLSKTKGWLCSIIAVGPFTIFIMGYSSLTSALSIIICILFASISGYIANILFPVK
jgi:hypothetical protein